jgi:hypothetical protein
MDTTVAGNCSCATTAPRPPHSRDLDELRAACELQRAGRMRNAHRIVLSLAATALLGAGCGTRPDQAGAHEQPPCGKCDDPVAGAGLDPAIPAEAAVTRLYRDALRDDGVIDDSEAAAMAAFARKLGGRNQRVVGFLRALLDGEPALSTGAITVLRATVSGERRDDVPLANDVYKVVLGNQDFLFDDRLYLIGDGLVEADTKIVSHSRGYAAKRDGVLFTRHGSLAPHYPTTSTDAQTEALRRQGPDEALDRAATVAGVSLDAWNTFGAIARDPNYYDPSSATPYWAGICQGWTHNALDNRLSLLVDVDGPVGARGLWIFGQWISRADLGNALMGASFSLGIADSYTIDSFVTPESLIKGLAQYVLRTGTGLRVDIWNDAHNASGFYDPQIWNQPIVGGSIEVASVSAETAAAIVAHASADPAVTAHIPADAGVKRVRATAVWGAEANDDWEGPPLYRDSEWNMYLIIAADGRVLAGYMAYALAEAGVGPLPVAHSDGLPDYMAVPRHELTDAALEHGEHRLLDSSHPEGIRFRFLVGTVLARGIPDGTRVAFEREVRAGAAPHELAARYPGIANAYSPEQWHAVFEPSLGPGVDVGAVWGAW